MDQNKERIYDALRVLLAAGGPFSAVILRYTDIAPDDLALLTQLALLVVPPCGAWLWGFYLHSLKKKAEAIAQAPKEVQVQVLQPVLPVETKVNLTEAIPGVATVVVRDDANGALAKMAASVANPKVVTESQNEYDAKQGTKVQV